MNCEFALTIYHNFENSGFCSLPSTADMPLQTKLNNDSSDSEHEAEEELPREPVSIAFVTSQHVFQYAGNKRLGRAKERDTVAADDNKSDLVEPNDPAKLSYSDCIPESRSDQIAGILPFTCTIEIDYADESEALIAPVESSESDPRESSELADKYLQGLKLTETAATLVGKYVRLLLHKNTIVEYRLN